MSLSSNCIYDSNDKFLKYVNFIEPDSKGLESWHWYPLDFDIMDFLLDRFQDSILYIGHGKQKQISNFMANHFPKSQLIGEVNASRLSKREYLIYKISVGDIKDFFSLVDFGDSWDIFFLKQEASDDLLKSIRLVGIDNIEDFMKTQPLLDAMISKVFYNNCTSLIFRKYQDNTARKFIDTFTKDCTGGVVDFDYVAN
jgi:hypothetical protein